MGACYCIGACRSGGCCPAVPPPVPPPNYCSRCGARLDRFGNHPSCVPAPRWVPPPYYTTTNATNTSDL